MISRKIGEKVQKINDRLGVPVKIPMPSARSQKISGVITVATGAGATITGCALKSKWLLLSGIVFVVGGALSYLDAEMDDK